LIKHRGEPDEDDLDVHITSAEELKKMTSANLTNSNDASQSQPPANNSPSATTTNKENSPTTNQTIDISPRANTIIEPLKSVNGPRKFIFN
jgi:hypothetical protein